MFILVGIFAAVIAALIGSIATAVVIVTVVGILAFVQLAWLMLSVPAPRRKP